MPHSAGQILIIAGSDPDFTATLAEQIKNELGLACVVVGDKNDVGQYVKSALAVVTQEPLPQSMPCPVLTIQNPPVKLQDILDDIASLRHNSADTLELGGGYRLQLRQKQLIHRSGITVSLTDKEVQLLSHLASGEVVSKEQLLKSIWGFGEALDTHTLETHIYRLRGKFRELAKDIKTDDTMIVAVEGGYKLEL